MIDAFVVVLDGDVSDDDAETIKMALQMFKGVRSVEVHDVDLDTLVARSRARASAFGAVYKALWPDEAAAMADRRAAVPVVVPEVP